jgi:hypothetical protein
VRTAGLLRLPGGVRELKAIPQVIEGTRDDVDRAALNAASP